MSLTTLLDAASARAVSADAAPSITRVVVSCAGARAEDAARVLAAQVPGLELREAAVVVDGSGEFTIEFQDADASAKTTKSRGVELVGFVLGGDNPARARNTAIRNGGASAANGERCSGDAFAGCQTYVFNAPDPSFSLKFVKVGKPWKTPVVVRVVVRANDVDAVASNVASALGPSARSDSASAFKARGVVEYAAEDRKGGDSGTPTKFVSYESSKTPSPAIEVMKAPDSTSTSAKSVFSVKAFHVALPEGCGVVYL